MESCGSWAALPAALRDRRDREPGASRRLLRDTVLRPVLLAGLAGALAGACSSATVAPPAFDAPPLSRPMDSATLTTVSGGEVQAPQTSAALPGGTSALAAMDARAGTPSLAAPRPSRQSHAYAYLWDAAGRDPFPRRETASAGRGTSTPPEFSSEAPADGPVPGAPTGVSEPPGAANVPESPVAGAAEDATPGSNAQNGRAWSEQDLAELAPYLQGIASWYGPNFHGKLTANGETYNQYGLTAAHPVLPIGTRILVENLDNGRRVWLRINDRGPYAKGRILDLSRIAAERLGMIEQGTAPVRITVLKWPDTVQPSFGLKPFQQFTVQSAAYPELDRAEELRERLQARFPELPFFVEPASNGFFAVAAGPFDDEAEAKGVSRKIHRSGLSPLVRRYRN